MKEYILKVLFMVIVDDLFHLEGLVLYGRRVQIPLAAPF